MKTDTLLQYNLPTKEELDAKFGHLDSRDTTEVDFHYPIVKKIQEIKNDETEKKKFEEEQKKSESEKKLDEIFLKQTIYLML